ncbi:MAG: choice-of-anchor L domain-containing protein, partial [Bacteroidales bacterium]
MCFRKIAILLIIIFTGFYVQAQLTVTSASGITPQQLVQSILVGNGVSISNVTFNGSSAPISWNNIGSFTTGTTPTNLGFNSGIIMASADFSGAPGPNSGNVSNAVSPSTPDMSDPDLLAVVGSSVTSLHDAAILEFDFIPLSDTIKFRYVFGSDEYPEYISGYNDVFAFFISVANPIGTNYLYENIALLPGTNTPVSIYNVNNGSSNTGPCVNCQYYVNNTGGASIQADGMTNVLTAWAKVMSCNQYHIKLVIADANDRILDSWVFLEANSFSSPQVSIQKKPSNPNASALNAIEGCSNMILTFKYPFKPSSSLPISIVSISGTATFGTDYSLSIGYPTSNTFYIPTTADSVRL